MAIISTSETPEIPEFFSYIANIIEQARKFVGRTADLTTTVTYFEVGRMIVENEQGGQERAEYGQNLLKNLANFLTERFKKGFSLSNLKNAKQFYNTYKNRVNQTFYNHFPNEQKSQTLSGFLPVPTQNQRQELSTEKDGYEAMQQAAQFFKLGWSHYIILISIDNEDERRFYEIEAEREGWSYRHLKRQYHSSLYERLALSKDKNEVMRLSQEGQLVEKPRDILKSPLVLEFLGMAEDVTYSETDLETAIISKLQAFLLELGKGFLFEARQKRFTFDEQSFFVDLVFYNRLLQ